MWILTEEYNEYDQHGAYFVAAWNNLPTLAAIQSICTVNVDEAERILNGGGRVKYEDHWYNLTEYTEGEKF